MRAARFRYCLSLIYRLAGEPGWQEGQTENVSSSGVLFSAARDLPVDADVEIRITLPAPLPSGYAPTALCYARVVRTEKSRVSDGQAFGAAFSVCQLVPPEQDCPHGR